MATSTISFQGVLSDSTASCEFMFAPPSNLAGKNCYLEVKSFGLNWASDPTNAAAYDTYLLYSSLPQIQSLSVEPYGNGPYYKKVTATQTTGISLTGTGTYLSSLASTTDKISTTATFTSGQNTITVAAWSADYAVGMTVVATTYINTGTTVTALDQTNLRVTLSNTANLTGTGVTVNFYKKSVTMSAANANIVTGMRVTSTGTGIPTGTTVTAVANAGANITLSNYISSASPSLTFAANTFTYSDTNYIGLSVGDTITGTGIPSGTTVTAINTSTKTVTMSNYLTAALSAGAVSFTLSKMAIPTTDLSVGMTVSGVGIDTGTQITEIIDSSSIRLSRSLTSATTASDYTFTMPLSQMTQKLQAPLASLSYRGDSQGAPVLVRVPDGPQSVTFKVIRLDRSAITTPVSLLVLATLVDARSRPIPMN